MEPKRFEEQIKEQLQKREIKPSAHSWEKLEARLEQEKKPSGVRFWWIGAAAAIAGVFFFLGTLFNEPGGPEVVEETPQEVKPQEIIEKPKEEIMIASEEPEKKQEVLETEILPQKKEVQRPAKISEVKKETVQLAEVEPKVAPEVQSEKVVAEAVQLPSPVSDAEVDALLYTAMAELEEQNSAYVAQSVDAEELLQEVELELDRNFRQKVFEVLKEGFSKAKTAVANRNY